MAQTFNSQTGIGPGSLSPNQPASGFQSHASGAPQEIATPSCCSNFTNPFDKANELTGDLQYNLRYKRAMGLGLASFAASLIAVLVVSLSGCIYINFAPVFHLLPVLLPGFNRSVSPQRWAIICLVSIVLAIVSLFIELITGCILQGLIVNGIIIIFEVALLYVLTQMDPQIPSKVKFFFAQFGCLGEQAQLQTMSVRQSNASQRQSGVSPVQVQPHMNGTAPFTDVPIPPTSPSAQTPGGLYLDTTKQV